MFRFSFTMNFDVKIPSNWGAVSHMGLKWNKNLHEAVLESQGEWFSIHRLPCSQNL